MVSEEEFINIIFGIREKVLEVIALQWNYNCGRDPNYGDINCGFCFLFSQEVISIVKDAKELSTYDMNINDLPVHFWIYWNKKYYDAECIKGVNRWQDLPIFKQVF